MVSLLVGGIVLLLVSIALAIIAVNSMDIIGGADWPTFRHFYFGRYSTLAFYGIIAIIAALVIRINNKTLNSIASLSLPLLLFPGLRGSYQWFNKNFLVKWLGCGCPVIDEAGNIIENNFHANDFTALFWLFISVCVTTISVLLSKRIPKKKMWFRVLYIVGMLLISLVITDQFCQMMMWN
jgi:hypothetical protein